MHVINVIVSASLSYHNTYLASKYSRDL